MNHSKLIYLGLFISTNVAADGYTTDFESPEFGDPFGQVAGTGEWVIDNGISDLSFIVSSWDPDGGGPLPASQAAGLGGFYDSPGAAGTEVNLTRAVSLGLDSAEFDVDFTVIAPTASFPGVDTYGFSFKSPTSDLLRIAFEPSDGAGDLELFWYDEADTKHSILKDIMFYGTYHLSVDFHRSGVDSMFEAAVTGTNAINFSGILAGQAGATLTAIGADFDVVGDGDGFLTFDNLSVVPEPNTGLLLLVSALCSCVRRRRCA